MGQKGHDRPGKRFHGRSSGPDAVRYVRNDRYAMTYSGTR
jgi:hypothetical protein